MRRGDGKSSLIAKTREPNGPSGAGVTSLKVTLRYTQPPVWRRILMPGLNLRSFGPTDAVKVFSASRSHLRDLPAFVPFVSKIAWGRQDGAVTTRNETQPNRASV